MVLYRAIADAAAKAGVRRFIHASSIAVYDGWLTAELDENSPSDGPGSAYKVAKRAMERADYPTLLFEIENYARIINSLFTQFKPHDDRHPEGPRRDALHSSFFLLKNLMIMLYPFAPTTMDRLRESLRLPPEIFRVDELGVPLPAGHEVGPKLSYFPGSAERGRAD